MRTRGNETLPYLRPSAAGGGFRGARSTRAGPGQGRPEPAARRLLLAPAAGSASSARGPCLAPQPAGAPAGRAGGRQLQRSVAPHRRCCVFNAAAVPVCARAPPLPSPKTRGRFTFTFPMSHGRARPSPAEPCPRRSGCP